MIVGWLGGWLGSTMTRDRDEIEPDGLLRFDWDAGPRLDMEPPPDRFEADGCNGGTNALATCGAGAGTF